MTRAEHCVTHHHACECREAAHREEVAMLRAALADIADPIAALRRQAEAEGSQLNGVYAVALAADGHYLSGLARAALASSRSAR